MIGGLETAASPLVWAGFAALLLTMLALDLGVFHRRPHEVSAREAGIWSLVWVALSALFGLFVWLRFGPDRGLEFATGYLIEKALAVDNLFVFVLVFGAFGLQRSLQHRVLFWGVLGALVMRLVLVLAGGYVLQRFHWTIPVFGALLVVAGIRLLFQGDAPASDNFAVRFARRLLPMAQGEHRTFTAVQGGRRLATPMLVALVAVELADLAFAVESIPAVYAVTSDPFIVFTSNALAMLGLRSLYFLLARWLERFKLLHYALALILAFVGGKMLLAGKLEISPLLSVAVIAGLLLATTLVELVRRPAAAPRSVNSAPGS